MNACAELFTNFLKEKELSFESGIDNDGDSVVKFHYHGKTYRLYFSGNDGCYLSLYMVFENVPDDNFANALIVCNELNSQYKWVTFYIDKDNDIILHDDAILSVENASDEAFELLIHMLKISNDVKPRIMKAIYA